MAIGGEALAAILRDLADQVTEGGDDVVKTLNRFIGQTADAEDENVGQIFGADAQLARDITNAIRPHLGDLEDGGAGSAKEAGAAADVVDMDADLGLNVDGVYKRLKGEGRLPLLQGEENAFRSATIARMLTDPRLSARLSNLEIDGIRSGSMDVDGEFRRLLGDPSLSLMDKQAVTHFLYANNEEEARRLAGDGPPRDYYPDNRERRENLSIEDWNSIVNDVSGSSVNRYLEKPDAFDEASHEGLQARADRGSAVLKKLPAQPGHTYAEGSGDPYGSNPYNLFEGNLYRPGSVVTKKHFFRTTMKPDAGPIGVNTLWLVDGHSGRYTGMCDGFGIPTVHYDKGTRFQVTGHSFDPFTLNHVIRLREAD